MASTLLPVNTNIITKISFAFRITLFGKRRLVNRILLTNLTDLGSCWFSWFLGSLCIFLLRNTSRVFSFGLDRTIRCCKCTPIQLFQFCKSFCFLLSYPFFLFLL
ncbi:hypothetical protein HanRHA438_Chr00c75g0862651 [Helianthus annuus]|nr:hypothetical protein HanRHA438_Chr00c75g0862651 [Helianthus annuus]